MVRQKAPDCNRKSIVSGSMTLRLDTASNRLYDARGRRFLADRRTWSDPEPEAAPATGLTPLSAQEAVAWLQRDSGQPIRAPVPVMRPTRPISLCNAL